MRSNSDKQIDARVKEIISNLGHKSATVASEKNIHTQKQKRQEQRALSAIPSHVRSAHIGRVACPLHIIELTKNINKIAVSETLKINVGSHAVESELLSACHTLGHETLMIENNGDKELFVTRKQ